MGALVLETLDLVSRLTSGCTANIRKEVPLIIAVSQLLEENKNKSQLTSIWVGSFSVSNYFLPWGKILQLRPSLREMALCI